MVKRRNPEETVLDNDITQLSRSLAKGLDILQCYEPGETFLGNKDICERVGLPKQTVSRLTRTLVALGYLSYSESLCKYKLGSGVLALAYPLLAGMNFKHIVRPFMDDFANAVGGSVSMGQRFRQQIMFVESSTVRGTANAAAEVGSLVPIHLSAIGKAYLGSVAITERVRIVAELGLDNDGQTALHKQISQVASDLATQGFCVSSAVFAKPHAPAYNLARIAAAVPLCRPIDGEHFVINCGFPRYSKTPEQMAQDIGPRLVNMVRNLESALGLR